jgi:hypothetical protein
MANGTRISAGAPDTSRKAWLIFQAIKVYANIRATDAASGEIRVNGGSHSHHAPKLTKIRGKEYLAPDIVPIAIPEAVHGDRG